jgi:hypothetical protein
MEVQGSPSLRAYWEEKAAVSPAPGGIHHLSLTAYVLLSVSHTQFKFLLEEPPGTYSAAWIYHLTGKVSAKGEELPTKDLGILLKKEMNLAGKKKKNQQ